ncbi:hypothetical protein [Pseudonocardia acidicola]|uniref:hypothetical protein n=1 Tax=Pseudonocardia acidicola TaxID=2724939 RepID=UPI001EF08052|nr:hypothetical protein [Pseudonocardia acidicola]
MSEPEQDQVMAAIVEAMAMGRGGDAAHARARLVLLWEQVGVPEIRRIGARSVITWLTCATTPLRL